MLSPAFMLHPIANSFALPSYTMNSSEQPGPFMLPGQALFIFCLWYLSPSAFTKMSLPSSTCFFSFIGPPKNQMPFGSFGPCGRGCTHGPSISVGPVCSPIAHRLEHVWLALNSPHLPLLFLCQPLPSALFKFKPVLF